MFTVSRNLFPTASFEAGASVDSARLAEHITAMSKKPRKVEESTAAYSAKKPADEAPEPNPAVPASRTVDRATFQKVTDKIFSERKELLHKLAQ